MDSELDRTHPLDGEWDEQTRREWEEWLDECFAQEARNEDHRNDSLEMR